MSSDILRMQVHVDQPASLENDVSDSDMMAYHVKALNQQLIQVTFLDRERRHCRASRRIPAV